MVSKWRDVVVPHPVYLRPACPSGVTVPCNDDDDDGLTSGELLEIHPSLI